MKTFTRLLSAAVASCIAASAAHAFYLFSTLPVLPDYDVPAVYQMNENSVIIGTLSGSFGPVGARWKGSTLTSFAGLGPGYAHSAWAYGMNNAGLAVGMLDVDGSSLKAYYNAPLLGSALLPTPAPAGVTTELRVINDAGYAVGKYTSAGVTTAFYTHPLGTHANLPSAKVGANFVPVAINEDSDVLGNSSLKGVVYNLLTQTVELVTARVPDMTSAAALNNLGDVAGVKVGNTAYILPKPDAAPAILLGAGNVKAVHAMNDGRELLVTTMDNRPAILAPADGVPGGVFTYLDTLVSAPWTIDKLADINNAGNICGVVKRPATPADGVPYSTIYRPFRLTNFTFFVPIFP
ncbi:hypothetical protein DB347_21280 [Opitutaceae bacterium EW11]|nr:hypothetical protein DB347_21280 [Opitutaceae bacterium EW11]